MHVVFIITQIYLNLYLFCLHLCRDIQPCLTVGVWQGATLRQVVVPQNMTQLIIDVLSATTNCDTHIINLLSAPGNETYIMLASLIYPVLLVDNLVEEPEPELSQFSRGGEIHYKFPNFGYPVDPLVKFHKDPIGFFRWLGPWSSDPLVPQYLLH